MSHNCCVNFYRINVIKKGRMLHNCCINFHRINVTKEDRMSHNCRINVVAGNFFGRGDGAGCRAALLSGPPGIGKTTTATLVCQVQ